MLVSLVSLAKNMACFHILRPFRLIYMHANETFEMKLLIRPYIPTDEYKVLSWKSQGYMGGGGILPKWRNALIYESRGIDIFISISTASLSLHIL